MAPSPGDTCRVHYRGTLADGTEFDSSADRDPLEFTLGAGQVIPGFEEAVAELAVGAKTTVKIPAAEAYGDRLEEAVQTVPREFFSGDEPEVGWAVELAGGDGRRLAAIIAEVNAETVTLDFNHPLAGQNLTFDIELVEVLERRV